MHGIWNRAMLATLIVSVLLTSACASLSTSQAKPGPGGGKQNSGNGAETKQILVSAAISLKDALNEAKQEFEKENPGVAVTYNLGASGTLQLQIEQGANVDVFASAAETQMDALESKGLILPGTRRDFVANTAVLVVPKNGNSSVSNFSDLTKPEVKRIAIGNPGSVPAGDYAKQILTKLGMWASLQNKFVLAENVRQVLVYVEQGEVDAGIVYRTDAATSDKVKVVATAPESASRPIVYPIGVISRTKQPKEAKAFVDFITGPKGQAILAKYGFLTPSAATPKPAS